MRPGSPRFVQALVQNRQACGEDGNPESGDAGEEATKEPEAEQTSGQASTNTSGQQADSPPASRLEVRSESQQTGEQSQTHPDEHQIEKSHGTSLHVSYLTN